MKNESNTVRAVSVHYGHALAILRGEKTEEIRSWTLATGDLVICTTARDSSNSFADYGYSAPTNADLGVALCIVHVDSCNAGAWQLSNVRPLVRVPVKGALGIWRLDASRVRLLSPESCAPMASSAPKVAKQATAKPQASAEAPIVKRAPRVTDDSAAICAGLVARCKALQNTTEIADLVSAMRRRVVETWRVLRAE